MKCLQTLSRGNSRPIRGRRVMLLMTKAASASCCQRREASRPPALCGWCYLMECFRPVITHPWKQSFHPSTLNDQQQGSLGLRELQPRVKKKKRKETFKIPGAQMNTSWESIFPNYMFNAGFSFPKSTGLWKQERRSRRRLAAILANNRKLSVASQSGIWAQRAALKMWLDNGVWHTPLMELSHRHASRRSWAFQKLLQGQAFACAVLGQGDPPGHFKDFGAWEDVMCRCQEDLWFDVWEIRK